VRSNDGRVVRIGDKIIIRGSNGNAEGTVVKIEPTPSGHQLFMVTKKMRKYQYWNSRSLTSQVYRFSLDNCNWKKDNSEYVRKPVQKQVKDRSDESVNSYPGPPKKYQKKKTSCLSN
jgi:hypothetical protein